MNIIKGYTDSLMNGMTGYDWSAEPTSQNHVMGVNPLPIKIKIRDYIFYTLKDLKRVNGPQAKGETVEFDGWVLIEDPAAAETLMIAFDPRGSVTSNDADAQLLRLRVTQEDDCLVLDGGQGLHIGQPDVFIKVNHGDIDDAINHFRFFLQNHVLPPLTSLDPQLSYNVWYTDDAAERLYLEDAEFAAWMGFDVFTIDASWNEGGSVTPATNDWGAGLGSYQASAVKFPHGIRYLSDKVHELGLQFGLWVDPQNVDSRRVRSGEIPHHWVAQIKGRDLQCDHPTLSLMTELCLGNPEVVTWLKQELARVFAAWRVDWVKWDPSGTASYSCDRADHGHGSEDGARAYFDGRREIMHDLFEKFPALNGWECISDMQISRVNPVDSRYTCFLPAYVNQFVTGPMVGPHVWGSMEYTFGTHESALSLPDAKYYEASFLDYFFRRILAKGGLSMGNITGIVSQRLRNAPLGYNDAFKRNMLQFKRIRHLYREDTYRNNLLEHEEQWRALQYVKRDASEAVLYVFRDGGVQTANIVRLRGLDEHAEYQVSSFNERPGKEKMIGGCELMRDGLTMTLPHPYLAKANYQLAKMDEATRAEFEKQLIYGSDVIVMTKMN
jgi:hypothetical protein